MPKIYLLEAIRLVGKTLPILWVRLGSYLLLGVGLAIYAALFFGIGWLLGSLWAPLGFIVFIVAVGGAFAVVKWAGRFWFHLLRAAHTAVLTEFIVHGRGPETDQLTYGRQQVMSRFRDTSILFAVDLLVGGVVRVVVRTLTRITAILPIPGLQGIGNLIERIAISSTTYIDEAILSRAYQKREQNVWAVARDGIVLYAQAWKPILANAVVLALLSFVEFLLFLLILGLPALAIGAVLPGLRVALGIGVLIGAWMLKLALSDAISLAATLLAYHRGIEGLTPDPTWTARIDKVSDKFRELGRKAAEAPSGGDPDGAPDSDVGGTPAALTASVPADPRPAATEPAAPEPAAAASTAVVEDGGMPEVSEPPAEEVAAAATAEPGAQGPDEAS